MTSLFSLALFVLAVCSVAGYGALLYALRLSSLLGRLDPGDAAAVVASAYRAGTRGNERLCSLCGPAGLAAVALSQGRVAWSAPWLWGALACWAASVGVMVRLVQRPRRALLVTLAELAGTLRAAGSRRARIEALLRRTRTGALIGSALFAVAVALVAFRPGG